MEKFRKLTPHDLAFGIGRKATDEELREMLDRAKNEKIIPADKALDFIKKRLAKNNIKKAS
ncbi:MAG: hypothetical protein JSS76_17625 [Bacteroidetes bacterium]|nr:hypothetical protein [Bacteroidota bacterium]MBS1686562.1 hypothetical protein [Bacteroidota bacterium]